MRWIRSSPRLRAGSTPHLRPSCRILIDSMSCSRIQRRPRSCWSAEEISDPTIPGCTISKVCRRAASAASSTSIPWMLKTTTCKKAKLRTYPPKPVNSLVPPNVGPEGRVQPHVQWLYVPESEVPTEARRSTRRSDTRRT